ncbi:MAG TPA: ribosome silencing factor [Actinomycetota bacterium]|nr:ribosome silencing factor [Actinomycetota bacterium]
MTPKDGVPGRPPDAEESREAAVAAARAAAAKQAEHITILDVHGLIVITDYFVICSGATERQVRTIVEEIEKALRDLGRKPVRREGESERRWVLLDYVDLVVHVFTEQEREYYDLERLWGDAPRSAWEDEGIASSSG